MTPNEFWEVHSFTAADVISGIFYLCWVPVPMGFAAFLFYHDRQRFLEFSLTFLITNLIGFVVYYLYPAAPPWYVKAHGFDLVASTAGNAAGLVRFDRFFGVDLFQAMYTKSSNVFAAMPSLHSAYPLIVVYFSWKSRLGVITWLFGVVAAGIWFAAVYTGHHYVLDVLAGVVTAAAGIALFRWMQLKSTVFKRFLHGYAGLIS
jgi:inositol phosphorylceramide synthase catalytic subunit